MLGKRAARSHLAAMDSHASYIYLHEAATQCGFAVNALKGLQNVLARLRDARDPSDVERSRTLHAEVFRSLHSFLTHASNVSRLFWPPAPRRRSREGESRAAYKARCAIDPSLVRGRALRDATGLPERDHALKSRRMRDHLEHFDERLDEWYTTSTRRNYVQDYIGPPGGIVGIDPGDMMRCFDPLTNRLRFRGEEYDLTLLTAAVVDVQDRIAAALDSLEQSRRPVRTT